MKQKNEGEIMKKQGLFLLLSICLSTHLHAATDDQNLQPAHPHRKRIQGAAEPKITETLEKEPSQRKEQAPKTRRPLTEIFPELIWARLVLFMDADSLGRFGRTCRMAYRFTQSTRWRYSLEKENMSTSFLAPHPYPHWLTKNSKKMPAEGPLCAVLSISNYCVHRQFSSALRTLVSQQPSYRDLSVLRLPNCALGTAQTGTKEDIGKILASLPQLTEVDLRNNNLTPSDMAAWLSNMAHAPRLRRLFLQGNVLTAPAIESFGRALGGLSALTTLALGPGALDDHGLPVLTTTFPSLPHLEVLSFSQHKISSQGHKTVATLKNENPKNIGPFIAMLSRLARLHSLSFELGQYNPHNVIPSLQDWKNQAPIRRFHLSFEGQSCFDPLVNFVRGHRIETLDLQGNTLKAKQWGQLLNLFRGGDTPPQRLDLSRNRLGTRLGDLTNHLTVSPPLTHLTHLSLCHNFLTHAHMPTLVTGLAKMPLLVSLDVGHNPLNGEGFGILVKGLEHHEHLSELRARHNNLQSLSYKWLERLPTLRHLKKLGLQDNDLGRQAARGLQKAVSLMPWLTVLDITGNGPEAFQGFRSEHLLHVYLHGTDRLPL